MRFGFSRKILNY